MNYQKPIEETKRVDLIYIKSSKIDLQCALLHSTSVVDEDSKPLRIDSMSGTIENLSFGYGKL